jgi:hypothetical protein
VKTWISRTAPFGFHDGRRTTSAKATLRQRLKLRQQRDERHHAGLELVGKDLAE